MVHFSRISLLSLFLCGVSSAAWANDLHSRGANSGHPGLLDGHVSFYGYGTGYYLPGGYEPYLDRSPYYSAAPQFYPGDHVHAANRLSARHHRFRGMSERIYLRWGYDFVKGSPRAHYHYPYYDYRRAFYYPGLPNYSRGTNYPW